jgi:hypothetical protein
MVVCKERWMNLNPQRSCRFIKSIKFGAILVSLVGANLACYTTMPQTLPLDLPPEDQGPVQPGDQPAQPPGQDNVGTGEVIGGWYGPACDEAEGTFIYRWSVDLMKAPQTGQLAGVVKFHDCPGGGRVLYYVVGNQPIGTVYTLTGQKKEGGGDLFVSAEEDLTFTFDSSSGQITPNLAP